SCAPVCLSVPFCSIVTPLSCSPHSTSPSRLCFLLTIPPPPTSTLFPYTTLFRSWAALCRISVSAFITSSPLSSSFPCFPRSSARSEEHTSELQSHLNLVCRLLLEKKKNAANNAKHHDLTRGASVVTLHARKSTLR